MSGHHPAPPSSLFDKTTRWFERARAALLDELPCRQGCHRCCIGLFPVTVLDQQELQRGLRSLPKDRRQAIRQQATRQVAVISATAPELADNPFIDQWSDEMVDHVVEQYRDLPCPALQSNGNCGIYDFRPLACRSMGIPPETNGVVHGACDIQTFVPLIRLSHTLREEEEVLAKAETEELARLGAGTGSPGEELFLPYAFLSAGDE